MINLIRKLLNKCTNYGCSLFNIFKKAFDWLFVWDLVALRNLHDYGQE